MFRERRNGQGKGVQQLVTKQAKISVKQPVCVVQAVRLFLFCLFWFVSFRTVFAFWDFGSRRRKGREETTWGSLRRGR